VGITFSCRREQLTGNLLNHEIEVDMNRAKVTYLFTILAITVMGMGCSVVDPNRSDAIRELSGMHALAARAAAAKTGDQGAYGRAQAKVNGLIDQLNTKVDSVVPNPFARVDLSTTAIPEDVRADARKALGQGAEGSIAADILDWIYSTAKEARKESATALKKKLTEFRWPDWGTAHSPGS
jgi:hypothetical protein